MILEKTVVTEGDKTYNSLTHNEPFFAVGYDGREMITVDEVEIPNPEYKLIKLWTAEDEPAGAGVHIGSKLEGFGATADDWAGFLAKIATDGLIFPPEEV